MCSPRRPELGHRRSSLAPAGAGPPKLDLNLPPDYLQETAEDRLNRHIRGAAFPGGIPQPSRPRGDSQLVRLLKRVMSIPTEVRIDRERGRVRVGLSGATAELGGYKTRAGVKMSLGGTPTAYAEVKESDTVTRVSMTPDRPIKIETSHGDVRFSGSLSAERWEMKLSWGSSAPDLSTLRKVFREGEVGLRGSLRSLDKLKNFDDPRAVAESVSSQVEPIKRAVKAASGIAKLREGVSFQIGVSGPLDSGSSSGGTEIKALLTIRF